MHAVVVLAIGCAFARLVGRFLFVFSFSWTEPIPPNIAEAPCYCRLDQPDCVGPRLRQVGRYKRTQQWVRYKRLCLLR